ncbi:hypothetical protein LTR66_004965 [Elasticomyces elasticus]|nr:hypothetical protein LTR66_004965 [Elasticomyces elasticus]
MVRKLPRTSHGVAALDKDSERTGCEAALFEWAESYDSKVDYSHFLNKIWNAMPARDFIAMASNPSFLGNPLIKTQHFIGLSVWERTGEDEIAGRHQVRVAHQRYADESFTNVAVKGHNHGGATTWYKKIDGVWKFAGIGPEARWFEFDYEKVFEHTKV